MAMDEMKRQLFEQERWIHRLSALSGLVYMLSNSLQAVEMDGKDDYINAVGYISSSLSETELALETAIRGNVHIFQRLESTDVCAFAGIFCVKEKSPLRGHFFVARKACCRKRKACYDRYMETVTGLADLRF